MYFLRQRTRVSGPFSADQIKALLHRGRVARSDKVSTDRITWLSIADVPDLVDRPQPIEAVAPEPVAAAAPQDSRLWHYTQGGTQQPAAIDTVRLKGLVASGEVGAGEMVWTDGLANWQPVASVPELAPTAGAAAMPAAPGTADLPPVQGGGFEFLKGEMPPVQQRKRGWF
jgi:hypothetical protein